MLKYFVKPRKNPITSEQKFYAQLVSPEPLNIDAISRMIAQNCTLTRHDILACLSAFQEQMINALQEGKSVRLGDLGCFRVTLHSLGTDSEAEFSTANITSTRIRFTPAARLRKSIKIGAEGVSLSLATNVKVAAPGAGGAGPSLGE